MRSSLIFCGFILLSKFCAAQDIKNEYPKYKWAEGSIILINNIQLKGLIQYDEFNRVIRYQSIDKNETKSFREKDVILVEVVDKEKDSQRNFIPFNINMKIFKKRNCFFLKSSRSFQLLLSYRGLRKLARPM